MPELARAGSPTRTALVGLAGLASAMGIGRFAFTPLLPLMQAAGELSLAQGGTLARANYLGYLAGALVTMALNPRPGRAARLALAAVAALTTGMGITGSFALWIALRLAAGVASAFVLVGVSSWALPLLATAGRAASAGWVYSGVGVGIVAGGLVGLATGVLGAPPDAAWLVLGATAAAVAIACWRPLGVEPPRPTAEHGAPRGALGPRAWALVFSYGAFGFGYIVPATFLPAVARQLVPDPAVFAWTWPVFGLAATAATIAASRFWRKAGPRGLWAAAQVVMAAGVLAPAVRMTVATLLACAVCVGGTLVVATMAGIQEARRVAGAAAPRLIAAMTAAFALGQLLGPFTVTSLGSSASPGIAIPHGIAAAVLLVGVAALALGPSPAAATARP